MRLQFLGDALDHWKGALFQQLCSENLLKDLHVEPMITDVRIWTPKELNTYARLLQLKSVDMIIHSDRTFIGKRLDHFKSIGYSSDLFLDPDVGIATGKSSRKHIMTNEIELLLENNSERVLSIYQHARQGITMPERVIEVTNYLARKINIKDISCVSYECTMVAMLFISKNEERIESIYNYFNDLLGSVADRRINRFIF